MTARAQLTREPARTPADPARVVTPTVAADARPTGARPQGRPTVAATPARARPTAAPNPQLPPLPVGTRRTFYTVRANDNLYGLAERVRVPVATLATANGLDLQTELYTGQRLVIPTRAAPDAIRLPPVRRRLVAPRVRPLQEYAPELVAYLRSREGTPAAAIYLPTNDTLYVYNPSERYLMASTVMVPMLVTQLTAQYRANREATASGSDQLVPMIVIGDNDAGTQLYRALRGKRGIEPELRARGLRETTIDARRQGLSTTTAPDMARLLRSLYYGERLNAPLRRIAVGLLGGVIDSQRWGVPEGLGDAVPVAFKSGWLPDDGTWQVHQVGIAELGGENVLYSLYTSGQPSEVYGRETLESVGAILARRGARPGQVR